MSEPARTQPLTYAEYLEQEAASEVRHEFFDGDLWAMTGGTWNHALITSNLTIALGNALRGGPCRVASESVRIYFPTLGESAYPDLRVVCGGPERHSDDPLAVINPVLVVEVISDSTEAFDRGDKFARYRTLPSLQAYLLASQHRKGLELFERNADGTWTLRVAEGGERLPVAALDIDVAVDIVYEGVDWNEGSPSAG